LREPPLQYNPTVKSGSAAAGVDQGYFNDPENTRSSFEDGWFKTGDIGEIDDEVLFGSPIVKK
jgi:acyl-CoA synthetase (AMP-forming)/AMP-acid ligase II